MSSEKLIFGTAGVPRSTKTSNSAAGIERVRELGLDCMELEFVQGVRISEKGAANVFEAARKVESAAPETLVYMDFPREHWRRIRSNNAMERLNREIRRRTKSIGAFPEGQSALMLVCARLRHMEQSEWGSKTYLNMQSLEDCLPS